MGNFISCRNNLNRENYMTKEKHGKGKIKKVMKVVDKENFIMDNKKKGIIHDKKKTIREKMS